MNQIIIFILGLAMYKQGAVLFFLIFHRADLASLVLCLCLLLAGGICWRKKWILLNDGKAEKKESVGKMIGLGVFLYIIQASVLRMVSLVVPETSNPHIGWNLGVYAIICIILGPIIEEVLFRGCLQKGLRNLMKSPKGAILFTSVIFACMHPVPLQKISALMTGLAFGAVYEKTKSLKCSIVIHMTNNFMSIIIPMIGIMLFR